MENDSPINTQAQDTTVPARTTEEAQTPDPASGLNQDHQEIESLGPGSTDADDQSESPAETNYGKYPKDAESENSPSLPDGEQGHQFPPESPAEDSLDPEPPEPTCSPSDMVERTDAPLVSSSAALPEDIGSRPQASQEPPVVDLQDAPCPGHSSARLDTPSQDTLRKRLLAPGKRTAELPSWFVLLVPGSTAWEGPFVSESPSFLPRSRAFAPCPRPQKETALS